MGNTGPFSSYGGRLRVPLEWRLESWEPLDLHKCCQALLSSFERELGTVLEALLGKGPYLVKAKI